MKISFERLVSGMSRLYNQECSTPYLNEVVVNRSRKGVPPSKHLETYLGMGKHVLVRRVPEASFLDSSRKCNVKDQP